MSGPPGSSQHRLPGAPCLPHRTNGLVLNQGQSTPGYGFYPPNYSAPPGNYHQLQNKTASQNNDLYKADYYSVNHSVSSQNAFTHAGGTNVINTHQVISSMYGGPFPCPEAGMPAFGSVQGVATTSAAYRQTASQQSYAAPCGDFGNSSRHHAHPSTGSQEFPLLSGPYVIPAASSAAHSSVSYTSMPITNQYQYSQVFTSHSLPPVGQFAGSVSYGQHSTVASVSHNSFAFTNASHPPLETPQHSGSTNQKLPTSQGLTNQQLKTDSTSHGSSISTYVADQGIASSAKPAPTIDQTVKSSTFPSMHQENTIHQEGMQYEECVNNHADSELNHLSSSSDDEDEDEEEAEIQTSSNNAETSRKIQEIQTSSNNAENSRKIQGLESSSTTSSATPVSNNYDALEGGGYAELDSSFVSNGSPAHSVSKTPSTDKPFGYGYPSCQPGYQNASTYPSSAPSSIASHLPEVKQSSPVRGDINLEISAAPFRKLKSHSG